MFCSTELSVREGSRTSDSEGCAAQGSFDGKMAAAKTSPSRSFVRSRSPQSGQGRPEHSQDCTFTSPSKITQILKMISRLLEAHDQERRRSSRRTLDVSVSLCWPFLEDPHQGGQKVSFPMPSDIPTIGTYASFS